MERRKFIKNCCFTTVGIALSGSLLQSCETFHYATTTRVDDNWVIAKSEFIKIKGDKQKELSFVLISDGASNFPICVYKVTEDRYVASLLTCTHRGCELIIGGGVYTCPCHGSEFTTTGKVTEGPAIENLKTYKIKTDNENIYISIT